MHRLDGHNTGPKQHRRRGGRRWFPKASEATRMHKQHGEKKKKVQSLSGNVVKTKRKSLDFWFQCSDVLKKPREALWKSCACKFFAFS